MTARKQHRDKEPPILRLGIEIGAAEYAESALFV